MISSDPTYPLFPLFAFLSFVIVLIPLPWHLQAWNSGTCLFMVWTAIACLNQFVNSIVWRGNVTDWAPVWCDISSRLMIGASVAIPTASLCINRRLYKIATCQTASSYANNKRAILVDLAIGLGIPALQMVLQFIVQGHRYDIYEDYGCYPITVNTFAAYPLSYLWPNVICLVSSVYCVLTLRAFMARRAQFSQFVSSNPSLTMNRYFRLMSLAMASIFVTVPLSTYGLYTSITSRPYYPWKSWSDTHSGWYIIDKYPASFLRSKASYVVTLELSRWSLVLSAFIFFGFFGLAEESRRQYKLFFSALAKKRFGFESKEKRESSSSSLPVFRKGTVQKFTISKPISFTTTYSANTPSYIFSPPSSTAKTMSVTSDTTESNHNSSFAHPTPTYLYREPKAVGSYADLSILTPSTVVGPSPTTPKVPTCDVDKDLPSPPLLTAFPSDPRPRLGPSPKVCSPASRPLTYPSFEATELNNVGLPPPPATS